MKFFGFQKGKIEVSLPKFNFSHGEMIEGNLILTLKKPINAKGLFVQLIGEQGRYDPRQRRRIYQRIFDFSQPIDGEKEYSAEALNYQFKIAVPPNPSSQLPEGALGTVMKTAIFLGGAGPIRWRLIGRLAVPGFDITNKVKINIV